MPCFFFGTDHICSLITLTMRYGVNYLFLKGFLISQICISTPGGGFGIAPHKFLRHCYSAVNCIPIPARVMNGQQHSFTMCLIFPNSGEERVVCRGQLMGRRKERARTYWVKYIRTLILLTTSSEKRKS